MKLATAGDNCIDYYAKQNKMFPGGNPINVAVYAKRIQLDSSYTGAIGNDENGQFMLQALQRKGVDASHVYILPGKTAITQVELKNEERIFGDYDEGVLADFSISEYDIDFFLTHDLLHTGLWGNIEKDLYRNQTKGSANLLRFFNGKRRRSAWTRQSPILITPFFPTRKRQKSCADL